MFFTPPRENQEFRVIPDDVIIYDILTLIEFDMADWIRREILSYRADVHNREKREASITKILGGEFCLFGYFTHDLNRRIHFLFRSLLFNEDFLLLQHYYSLSPKSSTIVKQFFQFKIKKAIRTIKKKKQMKKRELKPIVIIGFDQIYHLRLHAKKVLMADSEEVLTPVNQKNSMVVETRNITKWLYVGTMNNLRSLVVEFIYLDDSFFYKKRFPRLEVLKLREINMLKTEFGNFHFDEDYNNMGALSGINWNVNNFKKIKKIVITDCSYMQKAFFKILEEVKSGVQMEFRNISAEMGKIFYAHKRYLSWDDDEDDDQLSKFSLEKNGQWSQFPGLTFVRSLKIQQSQFDFKTIETTKFENLEELSFMGTAFVPTNNETRWPFFTDIKKLELIRVVNLEDFFFECNSFPQLERCVIVNCVLLKYKLWASDVFPQIRYLKIAKPAYPIDPLMKSKCFQELQRLELSECQILEEEKWDSKLGNSLRVFRINESEDFSGKIFSTHKFDKLEVLEFSIIPSLSMKNDELKIQGDNTIYKWTPEENWTVSEVTGWNTLPKLERLQLSFCKSINDLSFAPVLCALDVLEELHIEKSSMKCVNWIKPGENLSSLSLKFCRDLSGNNGVFTNYELMKQLKRLAIINMKSVETKYEFDISKLEFENLVDFECEYFKEIDVVVTKMKNLRSLSVKGGESLKDIQRCSVFTGLERLEVESTGIDDTFFISNDFPTLRVLSVRFERNIFGNKKWNSLPNLSKITFHQTLGLVKSFFTSDFLPFSKSRTLIKFLRNDREYLFTADKVPDIDARVVKIPHRKIPGRNLCHFRSDKYYIVANKPRKTWVHFGGCRCELLYEFAPIIEYSIKELVTLPPSTELEIVSGEREWAYVKDKDLQFFYVPKNYLKINEKDREEAFMVTEKTKRYWGKALFEFISEDRDELSVSEGEDVRLLKDSGEWLFVLNKNKKMGFVPTSYVEFEIGHVPNLTNRLQLPSTLPPPPPVDRKKFGSGDMNAGDKVIALFEYEAFVEDELSFGIGDVFTLIAKDLTGWFLGEKDGKKGLFPGNYVAFHSSNKKITRKKDSYDWDSEWGSDSDSETDIYPEDEESEGKGIAMYDFDGTDDEELSIKEGEKLAILKDVGEWLFVRNYVRGDEGYVPATYVEWEKREKVKTSVKPPQKPSDRAVNYFGTKEANEKEFLGEYCCVHTDYNAVLFDELTIVVGDVIKIFEKHADGWWDGELKGTRGVFPYNFVDVFPNKGPKPPLKTREPEPEPEPGQSVDLVSNGKYLVLYDYEAVVVDELSIKVGEVVTVYTKNTDGWWYGEINKKRGLFPSNYIDQDGRSSEKKEEVIEIKDEGEPKIEEESNVVLGDVQKNWDPSEEDEIAVAVGDVIEIVTCDPEEVWWLGINRRTGKKGLFHKSYVNIRK